MPSLPIRYRHLARLAPLRGPSLRRSRRGPSRASCSPRCSSGSTTHGRCSTAHDRCPWRRHDHGSIRHPSWSIRHLSCSPRRSSGSTAHGRCSTRHRGCSRGRDARRVKVSPEFMIASPPQLQMSPVAMIVSPTHSIRCNYREPDMPMIASPGADDCKPLQICALN